MRIAVGAALSLTVVVASLAGVTRPAQAQPSAAADVGANSATALASYTLIAPLSASPSQLVARTVLNPGAACPDLKTATKGPTGITFRNYPTVERKVGPNAAPAFTTVKVCSAGIPAKITAASLGGRIIPAALPAQVKKVGLFADSGCRVDGDKIQDCLHKWPLAAIAQRIASQRPDVVLDPGDYYYRESACPPDKQAECGVTPPVAPIPGMPFTDSSHGWLVDAINPMSALFPVAPLALLRGNHEACNRGGNGFFLFFDPRPNTAATCEPTGSPGALEPATPTVTPTWAAAFNVAPGRALKIALVDSAYGNDEKVTSWVAPQQVAYQAAATLTAKKPGVESWLMTHRPILGRDHGNGKHPDFSPWMSVDQTAASQGLLGNYQMILSSHLHLVQAVQIAGLPPNLILGNGGTMLLPPNGYTVPSFGPLTRSDGQPIDPAYQRYPAASMIWTRAVFGLAIARPAVTPNSWSFAHEGPGGAALGYCTLTNPTTTAPRMSCA